MTATTVTVPTLLWVLPLILLILGAWVWCWNRWSLPRFRRLLVARARRDLVEKVGLTTEKADETIAGWLDEGWPDIYEEAPQ